MKNWRIAWRIVSRLLTKEQLLHLYHGLNTDDPLLLQGATTSPPPLESVRDWPPEGGDPFAYISWKSGAKTVGECEEAFAKMCFWIDQIKGEPAFCRWFLNFWDDNPRTEVRMLLIKEIDNALLEREYSDVRFI